MQIQNRHYYHFKLLCLAFVLVWKSSSAQVAYIQSRDSQITIEGTSTLHDWSMTSTEVKYQVQFEIGDEGKPERLNALTFSVPFESFKSGSNALDKNAYSTMDTEVHKLITFKMTSAVVGPEKIHCVGNLTIAGATNPIDLDANYFVSNNRAIVCSGLKNLKMSDFKIDPPVFMFGTVRTDDEIKINFKVSLLPLSN